MGDAEKTPWYLRKEVWIFEGVTAAVLAGLLLYSCSKRPEKPFVGGLEVVVAQEHYDRGCYLLNKEDYTGAIEAFMKAKKSKKFEDSASMYVLLGNALYKNRNVDEAMKVLREGAKKFPMDAAVHRSLGYVLELEGDYNGAAEAYSKVLELKPEEENTKKRLERCLLRESDYAGIEI